MTNYLKETRFLKTYNYIIRMNVCYDVSETL